MSEENFEMQARLLHEQLLIYGDYKASPPQWLKENVLPVSIPMGLYESVHFNPDEVWIRDNPARIATRKGETRYIRST